MKDISLTYEINASIDAVWKALTTQSEIEKWDGGPAKMDDSVGTEFELWDGDIHGKNIEVAKPSRLVQEWISGDWEKPSIVTFSITENGPGTTIALTQSGHPESEHDELIGGWKAFYLGSMKEYLETGK